MDVTLWNGKTSLLTKKFKYEKTIEDNETKFHPQLVTKSRFWNVGWYPHKTLRTLRPSSIIYYRYELTLPVFLYTLCLLKRTPRPVNIFIGRNDFICKPTRVKSFGDKP